MLVNFGNGSMVDAAQGSIVITDIEHAILSAVPVETLAQCFFRGDAV
jgi:regulator of extracellular matrix RemA (YlzA/DUF370 family)